MAVLADPLSRFPAIRTSDPGTFEQQLVDIFGATGLELRHPRQLDVRGNFVRLKDTALGFGTCGTAATIHFAESDYARLQLSLHGSGVTRTRTDAAEVVADRPCITSPGRPTVLDYGVGFEHLFLRVEADALARHLAVLLDATVGRRLEFHLTEFTSPALRAGLRQLVELLVQQLDDGSAVLSPLAIAELEQSLIVQLLFAGRHNFSALLDVEPKDAAPLHVRRVENYIESHWNRPITIEALVEVAGVSARTLFRAFEKARGCSPMVFVRKVGLERAHDLLLRPAETTSVTATALLCGFSNLGQFASAYRRSFGELPSQTLSRARR